MKAMTRMHPSQAKSAQRGASAVEFAFVFPILFLLVYGVIVYSYVYVLQQSITFNAQQFAEAAVAVNPTPEADLAERIEARVNAVATQSLGWLPTRQRTRLTGANGSNKYTEIVSVATDESVVKVTVEFTVTGLFPALDFPIVGKIPPLPDRLRAQAVARI
ncbi:MAG: pilus assembly protein [Stagnimonas sp.]|nr:pilus assembly protein [Stagnimonas sp.]